MTPPFKVVVTGFGPFRDHHVNASWVAVKKMQGMEGLGPDIELEIIEIPVEYATVDQQVPKLWKTHKPKLMVHVGVSGKARAIILEECARNGTYSTQDINGKLPKHQICKKSGEKCFNSVLNMREIVEKARELNPDINFDTSNDAGRYLCEYIYYTSMHLKKGPCAFVHVPPLNRLYNDEQLAQGLRTIIILMVEQIRSRC